MTYGIAAYRYLQAARERGEALEEGLESVLDEVAASGASAFEPLGLESDEAAERLGRLLAARGLRLPSLYANSRLHLPGWEKSVEDVLAQARRAKALGASLVITNPEPIVWGQALEKSDDELAMQQEALGILDGALASEEMSLAYHVHDAELQSGARELHAMLEGVPQMAFCLDAHWVLRGSGGDTRALSEIVRRYASRVRCVHVRQCREGVCTEALSQGDIDWPSLATLIRPALVTIELLAEPGTPRTLSLAEAHRQSVAVARSWFAPSTAAAQQ